MITREFKSLAKEVENFLGKETSGHDFYHAERVFNSAIYIQKHEGGNVVIIGSAALVHDLCRPWEKQNRKSHFGEEALGIIKESLLRSAVPKKKIQAILEVVRLHDVYDWTEKIKNKPIELQIVQDADNLDALGAIGIGRTFAFGGTSGRQIYLPGENLNFTEDFIDSPQHQTSTIAHFYEKVLKLKQNMNTKTGIRLAQKRHRFIKNFLEQFFEEWDGRFEK